jgi:DNA helicase IV
VTSDAPDPAGNTAGATGGATELARERDHLDAARASMTAMRERAESLTVLAGDAVSAAYLSSAIYRRIESLIDNGTTPLFFGRIDYADERFHVGRRHIHDTAGDPVVIDWRADMARPFYRASAADSMGLVLRRRFGFDEGKLTAYEDEFLGTGQATLGADSRILQAEIERPRVGPMRDIVATIQPDQDDIVRSSLATTVCVQGAPGTGKTAVGLHRAAFLLYAHRDVLRRSGVLFIGPNRAFLSYIGEVLPALGEFTVTSRSIGDLADTVPVTASEPADIAALKGDARMATVIRNAMYAGLGTITEPVVVPSGARRFRVHPDGLARIVGDLSTDGTRYGAARARLPMRIADAILKQMEESGEFADDRNLSQIARSRPVRQAADRVWPAIDPAKLLHRLWSDAAFLAAAADGVYDDAEQRALQWDTAPRSLRSAPWTIADVYCMDEIADLLDRTASFGHVILDEAQDLSAMQARAVGRRCSTGSATILGDLAQGTTPWSTPTWDALLAHLGKPDALLEVLTVGYRVPREIIEFANRLVPHIAAGVAPAVAVRGAPGALSVRRVSDVVAEAVQATIDIRGDGGSVGIVVPDGFSDPVAAAMRAALPTEEVTDLAHDEAPGRLTIVPATIAKGLEFDHVIVVEPAAIAAAELSATVGLRRLYVVLTRAVSTLTVLHSEPLPDALAG